MKVYIRSDVFNNNFYKIKEIKKGSVKQQPCHRKIEQGVPCLFIWNLHKINGYAIKVGRKSKRLRVQFEHLGKFHELSLPKKRVWLNLDISMFYGHTMFDWATYCIAKKVNEIIWE